MFVQQPVQANYKEKTLKLQITSPFGNPTVTEGDPHTQWIPLTEGHQCGNHFHTMTSSYGLKSIYKYSLYLVYEPWILISEVYCPTVPLASMGQPNTTQNLADTVVMFHCREGFIFEMENGIKSRHFTIQCIERNDEMVWSDLPGDCKGRSTINITVTSYWARWRLKSPAAPFFLNRLFRSRSNKTSKLRVTCLCVGNSPGTGEFHTQRASNAENVSIWWRHHEVHVNYFANRHVWQMSVPGAFFKDFLVRATYY